MIENVKAYITDILTTLRIDHHLMVHRRELDDSEGHLYVIAEAHLVEKYGELQETYELYEIMIDAHQEQELIPFLYGYLSGMDCQLDVIEDECMGFFDPLLEFSLIQISLV